MNTMKQPTRQRKQRPSSTMESHSSSGLLKAVMILLSASSTVSGFQSTPAAAIRSEFRSRRKSTGLYSSTAAISLDGADASNSVSAWNYRLGSLLSSSNAKRKQQQRPLYAESTATAGSASSEQRWWGSFLTPTNHVGGASKPARQTLSSPEEDTSQKVDEYLEFLDKRYNRLHHPEEAQKEVKPFSALGWLYHNDGSVSDSSPTATASEPSASVTHTEQDNDDALYALGVAGLASQKLLQKHQKKAGKPAALEQALPTLPPITLVVSNDPSRDDNATTRLSSIVAVLAMRIANAPLTGRIRLLRQRLMDFEARRVQALVRTLIRTPPLLAKRAWKLGGGSHNVVVAATVLTAVSLVLLRPLVSAILSAGASSQA